jgi:glycosyltransferase involved in cell wall biosynthesis
MFPKIREKIPDAKLNVFCNLKNNYVQNIAKNEMDEIEFLLDKHKDFITNHGWVSKDILINFWLETEYWLYPCTFQETFCVTALEAAASKTLVICNGLAALENTVGDRGIIIEGDVSSEEWQNKVIDKLININEDEKEKLIEKNRLWSENFDWNELAKKFVEEYLI